MSQSFSCFSNRSNYHNVAFPACPKSRPFVPVMLSAAITDREPHILRNSGCHPATFSMSPSVSGIISSGIGCFSCSTIVSDLRMMLHVFINSIRTNDRSGNLFFSFFCQALAVIPKPASTGRASRGPYGVLIVRIAAGEGLVLPILVGE